jgi:hypothetical protein
MFFDGREGALREMWRVVGPGGRLAVAVFGPLEDTPGYASMVALLERLLGASIASELRAPYSLGDIAALRALFGAAGIEEPRIDTLVGRARLPSIRDWVRTESVAGRWPPGSTTSSSPCSPGKRTPRCTTTWKRAGKSPSTAPRTSSRPGVRPAGDSGQGDPASASRPFRHRLFGGGRSRVGAPVRAESGRPRGTSRGVYDPRRRGRRSSS